MNIIYLDRLSFYSLISLILSGIKYSHIFYYNISSIADKITGLFLRLRLLNVKPQQAEFYFGDIRDESGECQFIRISEDIRDICFEISAQEFATNSFLKGFGRHFDNNKIVLFFEKTLADEIYDTVVFINAAKWHSGNKVTAIEKSFVYFHEKNLWSKYLTQYANKLGIKTIEYRSINSVYIKYIPRAISFALSKIRSGKLGIKTNKFPAPPLLNAVSAEKDLSMELSQTVGKETPLISAWYSGKTVTFDLKKRSDFFWLLKSNVPKNQVQIYFERKDIPATTETASILNKEGVNTLALSRSATTSDNIPIWNPGRKYRGTKRFFTTVLIKLYLQLAIKFNRIPLFYVVNMYIFIDKYSYWADFFGTNNIKTHISANDFTKLYAPKNLALEHCGGVSISFQWSNLSLSSITTNNCSNIMFSFGPAYKWVWEANHSIIDNLIYCGYITDYSFKEVGHDSFKLRKQLIDKGVKFVICFFDENSHNDRLSVITNAKSAETYAYFIRKMLDDETLGLIFKPGYPKTLFQRISSISDLIEKGKATGRCVFLGQGRYLTEKYPAEAAQAADLCIGLLLSGTVALESYLSGTPTVFLDLEKLYSNPIYQWGKGKVVFDNLDDLFMAINKYRENPESISGFGDLSSWVKDKDPFKDGNASLRMGQYINWLLEMFNQGKTRIDAIEYANQRYAEIWGKGSVVRIRDYGVGINSGLGGKD